MTDTQLEHCRFTGAILKEITLHGKFMSRADLSQATILNTRMIGKFFATKINALHLLGTERVVNWNSSELDLEDAELVYFLDANYIELARLFSAPGQEPLKEKIIKRAIAKNEFDYFQKLRGAIPDQEHTPSRATKLLHMQHVDLSRLSIGKQNFFYFDLSHAIIQDAEMAGSNFKGSRLRGVHITGKSVALADFSDADLAGATLTGQFTFCVFSSLEQTHIVNADMQSIRVADLRPPFYRRGPAYLRLNRAVLDDVKLPDTAHFDFTSATLSNMSLEGWSGHGKWRNSTMRNVNLKRCYLGDADLRDCSWTNVDVAGATLAGAIIQRCKLTNVNFRDARSLSGMQIDDASLQSLDWKTRDYLLHQIASGVVFRI